jgi:hypothetical protein
MFARHFYIVLTCARIMAGLAANSTTSRARFFLPRTTTAFTPFVFFLFSNSIFGF